MLYHVYVYTTLPLYSVLERERFNSVSSRLQHVDAGDSGRRQRGSSGECRDAGDRGRRTGVSVDHPRQAAPAHQHHPPRLLDRLVAVSRRRRRRRGTCRSTRPAVPAVVVRARHRDSNGRRRQRLGRSDVDAELVGGTLRPVRRGDRGRRRRQQRRWTPVDSGP